MVFRYRAYQVAPGKLEAFNAFFLNRLLPVQRRHGAKLVGRWQSPDGEQLVAIWAYESMEAYSTIQARVRNDPDSLAAQSYRHEHLNPLFTATQEWFMTSTVPLEVTELAHLEEVS